jgi:fumarate reductase subunit D
MLALIFIITMAVMALWMIVDNHRFSNQLHQIEMSITTEQLYYQITAPHRVRLVLDEEGFIVYE